MLGSAPADDAGAPVEKLGNNPPDQCIGDTGVFPFPAIPEKPVTGEPKVWFDSIESFAGILTSGNRELLHVIAERKPQSLEELAEITGKAMPNLLYLTNKASWPCFLRSS